MYYVTFWLLVDDQYGRYSYGCVTESTLSQAENGITAQQVYVFSSIECVLEYV